MTNLHQATGLISGKERMQIYPILPARGEGSFGDKSGVPVKE